MGSKGMIVMSEKLYNDFELTIIEKARIKKFQKETNTPIKLRNYFKGMVERLSVPLLEIDENFYECVAMGDFAENYTILDTYLIVHGYENEVRFKLSNVGEKEKELLSVTFNNDIALTREVWGLTEHDLQTVLITAFK